MKNRNSDIPKGTVSLEFIKHLPVLCFIHWTRLYTGIHCIYTLLRQVQAVQNQKKVLKSFIFLFRYLCIQYAKTVIRVGQCLIENNLKWAILVLTEILYSITKLLLYKIVLSNHDKNCNLLRYWNPNLIIEFIWEPDSQTQILPHSFWIWPKLSNANI